MIIVNFKTYKEATGKRAVRLAKELKLKKVMIAVQPADIFRIKKNVRIPLLAQHVDAFSQGRNTGYILPEAVKEAGCMGTLLNHAEHRMPFKKLKETIKRCKKVKLKTIVCSPNLRTTRKIMKLKPDIIAFEDPKLISTGKSISKVKPKQVQKFAKLLKGTRILPLCGAGISTQNDVKKALELGTKGILVASAVVKSKSPKKLVKSFLEVMK